MTNNNAVDVFALLSPNCQKIVFCLNRDGNFEIYSMDADGSNQMRLTNNTSNDWKPKWSPDVQKIAFISERDSNQEIYFMNPDGGNQKRRTNHSGMDIEPDCSWDGSKMVFVEIGFIINKRRIIMQRTLVLIMSLLSVFCIAAGKEDLGLVSTSKIGVGYNVDMAEGYAYVTNNDGVVIVDVRQPKRPRKVGMIPTGVTFGIYVDNGLAYISSESGLVIADVNDPENPEKLGECVIGNETHRIHVDGKYAYIASGDGLEILDVSDPGKITPMTHFRDSYSEGVDIIEGIAYLACHKNGVEVIDVKDPASPRMITTVAGTKGAWDVHIHGDCLYVGCHGNGIKILDISNKKAPRIIGSFHDDDGGEALGVWGDGKHLYVADNFNIEVLDVSDPANPFEVGKYNKVKGAHDICVAKNHIYVAEAKKGLIIFELKQPQNQ